MQVGNVVGLICQWSGGITQVGVIEELPEQYSKFPDEVLVLWNDGDESWYSIDQLELICR